MASACAPDHDGYRIVPGVLGASETANLLARLNGSVSAAAGRARVT